MIVFPNVRLTPREEQICRLILKGLSAKEVAQNLDMAPRTVDQHCVNVGLKLGSKNRAHMAAHLLVRGLITMTVADL